VLHRLERIITPLLLILLLASGSVRAAQEDTRWYDVEVILFVQKSQNYRDSEVWPVDYTLPDIANARELTRLPEGSTPPEKPTAFRELLPDELQLTEDAERVDKASDLELLTHFGWRQPGLPEDKAVGIRVIIPANESETTTEKNATPETAEVAMGDAQQAPPRMEGTLKLILSRYLHIEADLLYREPLESDEITQLEQAAQSSGPDMTQAQDQDAPLGTQLPAQQQDLFMLAEQSSVDEQKPLYHVYRMQQSRRMRSGELHYIDHPVFGLAVRVTQYEPPTDEEETKQQ